MYNNIPAISGTLKVKINNIGRGMEREKNMGGRMLTTDADKKEYKDAFPFIK